MVFRFDRPHKVGSICNGRLCPQCLMNRESASSRMLLFGDNGEPLPPEVPLYIVSEATEEQWRMMDDGQRHDKEIYGEWYFYVVSTD